MNFQKISNNEDGFVLVVALMIMVILSLIGIAGLNTSMFEEQIAGNDWNAKRTFYKADGGASLGIELLEQSFNCAAGFKPTGTPTAPGPKVADILGTIRVKERSDLVLPSMAPWYYPEFLDTDTVTIKDRLKDPSEYNDAAYPLITGTLASQDVGYLYFGGKTSPLPGGSFLSQAGYLGMGKSAAQGGLAKTFDIYSQFIGLKRSESIIVAGWRHLIGTEESCDY